MCNFFEDLLENSQLEKQRAARQEFVKTEALFHSALEASKPNLRSLVNPLNTENKLNLAIPE